MMCWCCWALPGADYHGRVAVVGREALERLTNPLALLPTLPYFLATVCGRAPLAGIAALVVLAARAQVQRRQRLDGRAPPIARK